MPLRPFRIPGQPELQQAFNKLVDAINSIKGTQGIIGRNGVRVLSDGSGVVVELEEQRRAEQPRFYPYVVSRYGVYGVSLTPGFVRWTRRRASTSSTAVQSIQRVPLLNDPSIGLRPISDSPAPAATLSAGYWVTWLVLSPDDVRVEFKQENTPPTVPDGANAVAINRFQLVMRGAVPEVVDVEVYDNSATAEDMEDKAAFAVTMTGASSCHVSSGRLAYTDWNGASVAGEPLFALREMTVGAATLTGITSAHRVWLKVTYSKIEHEDCGVAAGFYFPAYASIVALTGNPPNTKTEGHILLAEFRTVKASDGTTDVLWVQQVTEGSVTAPCPTAVSGVCSTSSDSMGSTSGSDKSTAIVPVSWSPTGYSALFCKEAPEVRFDDVIPAPVTGRINTVAIDPRFLSVCEKGTVRVVSAVGDCGAVLWARKEGGLVRFAVSRFQWLRPASVVIVVDGVRRGFRSVRFPTRTAEQFHANEAFLNSAYPPS